MKILIEESALNSIKRMAQEVQDQRDELLAITLFSLDDVNFDPVKYDSMARAAIARCQESTKIFE
jgi:hypothetical protein